MPVDRAAATNPIHLLIHMWRNAFYTVLALIAFAANSLLCRLALASTSIDPASFTSVRLVTGAIMLSLVMRTASVSKERVAPSWNAASLLFLYAVPFSFAYRHLTAGTGALLLFGAVQVTMILGSFRGGHGPGPGQWIGLALAFGGLIYLVFPGLAAPSPLGAGLMLLAGLSWGLYTLKGRTVTNPLGQTASNFTRTVPMALILCVISFRYLAVDPRGLLLATLSGAIASGLGYVLWYLALPGLSPITASVVQLAVPPLAAAGGIGFLGERVTWRLGAASLLVLGGIAVSLHFGRRQPST